MRESNSETNAENGSETEYQARAPIGKARKRVSRNRDCYCGDHDCEPHTLRLRLREPEEEREQRDRKRRASNSEEPRAESSARSDRRCGMPLKSTAHTLSPKCTEDRERCQRCEENREAFPHGLFGEMNGKMRADESSDRGTGRGRCNQVSV